MNWLWMHVLKCNMHEKSAGHADLGWFFQGSHACLMASPQAPPFLFLPSRFWNTFPLHLTVNCQCIMFFSLIVLSKPDSDRTLPVTVCFTLTATLATEQVAIVSSSKALQVLSIASCVKTTGAILPALTLKTHEAKKHRRQVVSQTFLSFRHLWTREKIPRMDVFWWNGNKESP